MIGPAVGGAVRGYVGLALIVVGILLLLKKRKTQTEHASREFTTGGALVLHGAHS